jgi:hypothetical protein
LVGGEWYLCCCGQSPGLCIHFRYVASGSLDRRPCTCTREGGPSVGMRPVLQAANKWEAPWSASFSDAVSAAEELISESELDPTEPATSAEISINSDVTHSNSDPALQAGCSSGAPASRLADSIVLGEATIRSSILDALQEVGEESDTPGERLKISPTVEVPEKGLVYKVRLITEFNASPGQFPLDRLRRVRFQASANASSSNQSAENEVGLFDDVAMEILDENMEEQWYLARVQKMFKVTQGGGRIDHQVPVSIAEDERDSTVRLIVK